MAQILKPTTRMACAGNNTIAALLAGAIDATAARSLEAHLDGCPACRHLVAELGRGLSAVRHERMPREGDVIGGRYEIARVLGVGGMGIVYEAHDTKLARSVAIKILRPDFVEELGTHLLAEAQAMARLQHPNIVAVHDIGTHANQLYICMEYVAGQTLRAWHGKPWRDVLAVYRAAGAGLAYVHRSQLVHLDFKPDNVLVDANGRPRVTDFGVARIAHHADVGCIVGTPGYMAPEQRRGDRLDARTDQYAFCASLREALGDRRYPRWLARVIERGMSAHPRDRFITMDALVDALVPPPSKRRHVGAAIVLASLAIAFVATTVPRPARIVTRAVPINAPASIEVVREREIAREKANAKASAYGPARARAIATANARANANGRANAGVATFVERGTRHTNRAPIDLPTALAVLSKALASSSSTPESAAFTDVAKQLFEAPGPCDDGSVTTCSYLPPTCPTGTVTATHAGCWTCATEDTCEPLGLPRTCGDGSHQTCSLASSCDGYHVLGVVNGCLQCLDPFTCPPPPPKQTTPKQPEVVANGSGQGSGAGSGGGSGGSGVGSGDGSGGSGWGSATGTVDSPGVER